MNTAKEKRQVTVTLPIELYNQLAALAEETGRTPAGYIRWVLRTSLQNQESGPEERR